MVVKFGAKSRIAAAIAAAGAAITLSGAALAGGTIQSERCVQIGSISGYSVIDDRHLILRSGASSFFLVTTATRCSGLNFGVEIATSITGNQRICQPMSEFVIPDDGWRCRIASIEAVENEDAARALVEERRQSAN
ncbi:MULTISPECIES: DUF6491 family protein [Glycocaulis]|uniref:DUF6491 family protein n=1 Tax=Glycocaulis TaxID=1433402 RepID=UPI000FDAB1DF|nr:DUF6491 family protein [Glycocaulis alkaliphilus]GGB83650.1 hypothetical protein GCM10007417_24520 [Glycocaulis alkaliphilus]